MKANGNKPKIAGGMSLQGCPDGECEEGKTASGFPSLPPIYEPFWEPHESPFGKPADDLEQFKALSWPTDDGRPVVNGTNATDVEAEEEDEAEAVRR
jgi:hypothetical protein